MRRVRAGQYEDALVRAYRTLELIGQIRLFDRGLDSGNLDPDHVAVKALQDRLKKKNDAPLPVSPGGELQAGRSQVARILKRCVLVHDFVAGAPGDLEPLQSLFNELDSLVREDGGPAVGERLQIARSPAFRTG